MAGNTSPELSNLDPTPAESAPSMATTSTTSAPPKPQRPQSPRTQAKATLKEAFPNVDDGVIEAVLIASGGNIEPAFNALLGILKLESRSNHGRAGMTDPSYTPESADAIPRHDEIEEVHLTPLLYVLTA